MWLQDERAGTGGSGFLPARPGVAQGRRRGSCCRGKRGPRRSAALATVYVRSRFTCMAAAATRTAQ